MEGRKIQMAREAVALSIQLLKPDDHLGVVCYDDQITAVLDRTHATKEAKALASRRLEASMLEAPRTCMAARSVALNWRGTPRPTQWRR